MHPNDAADRAAQIKGWMTLEELRWLARTAAGHQRILEIGTYMGRSTVAMALTTPGTVTTLDIWRGEIGTPEHHGHELNVTAHQNIRDAGVGDRVEMLTMSSAGYLTKWRAEGLPSPSLIFIDANHDEWEVAFDVQAALEMAAPSAVIAGHDFGVGQVKEALARVLPEAKPVCHTIWEYRKP